MLEWIAIFSKITQHFTQVEVFSCAVPHLGHVIKLFGTGDGDLRDNWQAESLTGPLIETEPVFSNTFMGLPLNTKTAQKSR
jgi:hypothetical protein